MWGADSSRRMLISNRIVGHLLLILLMLGHGHVILILLLGWISPINLLLLLHFATLFTSHFWRSSSLAFLRETPWVPSRRLFAAHLLSASSILRTCHSWMHHGHSIVLLPAGDTESVRHIGWERIATRECLLLLVKGLRFSSRCWLLAYRFGKNGSWNLLLLLLRMLIKLLLLLNYRWMALSWWSSSWNVRKLDLSRILILIVLVTLEWSIQLLSMQIRIRTSIKIWVALFVESLHLKRFVIASRTSSWRALILILVL